MSEEIIATDRDDRYVRRDGVEERLRRSVCGAVVADFEDVGALRYLIGHEFVKFGQIFACVLYSTGCVLYSTV
jgi:hypothetical protein